MPRLGPPLREYVPQVAIPVTLADPERIGPEYETLRELAMAQVVDERTARERREVEQCIRNRSGCKPGEPRLSERV